MFLIPPLTSDIITLSCDIKSSPSISINLPEKAGASHSHGWGFGWYPDDQSSAMIIKNPIARGEQVLVDAITEWSNFRSTVFFCKIRGASKGYSHAETQPFSRAFLGRDWLFMHNGDVDKAELKKNHNVLPNVLEPLGKTDSELIFCLLLAHMLEMGAERISNLDPVVLHSWFARFDLMGSADIFFSDGSSTICFHGTQSPKQMYTLRIKPPDNQKKYESEAAQIKLNDARDTYRTALIVSSCPFFDHLADKGDYSANPSSSTMQPGQMLILRRGAIVWDSHLTSQNQFVQVTQFISLPEQPQQKNSDGMSQIQVEPATKNSSLEYRILEVQHITQYTYTIPVEHSTHLLRLQPISDLLQNVIDSKVTISTPAEETYFEDVFGNQSIHCAIDQPYSQLIIKTVSRVKIFTSLPDDHSLSRRQNLIPLFWMPWQSQMMMPYLLPWELPESQLDELTQYAMSFVKRNEYRLLATLKDMNQSIYNDFKYVSGSTSVSTTPFDVYTSRQGVCQDFANLFICMARLLNIPARYRMGYIYTGTNYANKIQSDASHAWVEVYLPYLGWRGFDPTNACMVEKDHIRVACGRNYIDATPTSGTIYKGGGAETLTVNVEVREV